MPLAAPNLLLKDSFPVRQPPQTQSVFKKYVSARQQAVEMQRLLSADAKKLKDPVKRAVVARAWCDLNEEVRKLAMKPLPRPIDTIKYPAGRAPRQRGSSASQAAPVEPTEPETGAKTPI